jgi:putative NADPH-quinone reductase
LHKIHAEKNMRILVVLGHPGSGSFNHAIAAAAVEQLSALNHEIIFHDLCAENFDPDLPASEFARDARLDPLVEKHCRDLSGAEGIIIVHPNWWGAPPAVMKGWIDRVFRPEVAYRFIYGDGGEGVPLGLLKARTALVFHTANTSPKRELESFGDPLDNIWRRCVFGLCGVSDVRRRTFAIVCTSSEKQRESWLEEVGRMVKEAF